ncbi:MAG: pitrilysin family protein [Bdellovibrionales bacterium]
MTQHKSRHPREGGDPIFFLLFFAILLLISLPAYAINIQEVVGKKSGVKAWLVENHKLPVVAMHFAFQGGNEQDPADKQGLAALTTGLLTQGAGPYDAAAFQQQLADRSISIGFSAERDKISGGLKCLSVDKDTAFDLLRLAITEPRFNAADIERQRAQHLSGIRRQFSDPNWQARNALVSQIYARHPYSQRRLGTLKTLESITRDDIQEFAAKHLARATLTVAVAGDMTPDELSAALDKTFVDLPARAQLTPIADSPEIKKTPTVLVRRDGTQTELLFAMPGPKRSDPDYYAAEVANYVIGGGGFASRLMQEVRDKKGLTYGISTYLSPAQHGGLIVGGAAVDNPKAAEALNTILDALRRFHDEGLTEKELEAAKDYLTGAMPLALTSTDKIAGLLVSMQREKLGRDYLDRYNRLIRSVSKGDIERVLERFFNPDKMTLVMVGKPKSIVPAQTKDTVKQ